MLDNSTVLLRSKDLDRLEKAFPEYDRFSWFGREFFSPSQHRHLIEVTSRQDIAAPFGVGHDRRTAISDAIERFKLVERKCWHGHVHAYASEEAECNAKGPL